MNPTRATNIWMPSKASTKDSYRREPQTLSNTGTVESKSLPFPVGIMATLLVGNVAVRVAFDNDATSTASVATSDMIIPAGGMITWTVDAITTVVHVEAADGASAYESWAWKSSP